MSVTVTSPFNNRWLAIALVVGVLLIVAELVGTGENGGILASFGAAPAGEQLPEGVNQVVVPAEAQAEQAPVVVVDEGDDEDYDDESFDDSEPADDMEDDGGSSSDDGIPVVVIDSAPQEEGEVE